LPQTLESGDALHSLTALMMLDALRKETLQPDNPKPHNSD
jgi:hypothetical protein